jgi:CRP/FNR family transcriptional regulator
MRYSVEGKDRAIFNQGEPFDCCYFVCRGIVKLTRLLSSGEEVIIDVLAPFSVLSGCPDDKNPVHAYSALTVSKSTEIAYLNTQKLLSLFQSDPSLGAMFLYHLRKRLDKTYGLLSSMKMRVRKRMLLAFTDLLLFHERETQPGWVRIPISQTELAQFVQSTPETVSRILHQLREEEVVRLDKKGEIFVAEAKLQKMLHVQNPE